MMREEEEEEKKNLFYTLKKKTHSNMPSTKKKIQTVGSKAQVYNGTAKHTSGGVTKAGIMKLKNPNGTHRYVFKAKHHNARGNPWIKAVTKAKAEYKKETGKDAPVLVHKGTKIYKRAKELSGASSSKKTRR